MRAVPTILMGGVLPFGVVFVELFFILTYHPTITRNHHPQPTPATITHNHHPQPSPTTITHNHHSQPPPPATLVAQ